MKRTEVALQFVNKGEKLFGVLHLPKKSGKFPCVVFVHGFTGHKAEAHFLFTKMARKLAEKGIAAFRFDCRGSGDSESTFDKMSVGTEISDTREAIHFIKKHPNIKKEGIGVLGLSMGGFVAAYTSGTVPGIKAAVLWSAVAGYRDVFSKNRNINFKVKHTKKIDIGGLSLGPGFFKAGIWYDGLSLISVNEYREPLLVVHSADDCVVPLSHGELYYRASGSKVRELKVVKKGGHTFEAGDAEAKVIDYTAKWLKKNLKG